MISIKGQKLNIDILEELERFHWEKPRIRGEKFIACSPLREGEDRRPSFAVNLNSGVYIDSAHASDYWRTGTFQKLLSFLLSESLEQVESYLLEKYSPFKVNTDELKLKLDLNPQEKPQFRILSDELLVRYKNPNEYLTKERGLSQDVLDRFDVGFDPNKNLTTFVWRDRDGNPINVKFRKNNEKSFFYLPEAEGIKRHLYLFDEVFKNKKRICYITESEIDSLYIRGLGENFSSIALGGAHLSSQQERLLLSSPVETFILATDNDEAGKRISNIITSHLMGYKKIKKIVLPEQFKDVNEVPVEHLRNVLLNTETPRFSFLA